MLLTGKTSWTSQQTRKYVSIWLFCHSAPPSVIWHWLNFLEKPSLEILFLRNFSFATSDQLYPASKYVDAYTVESKKINCWKTSGLRDGAASKIHIFGKLSKSCSCQKCTHRMSQKRLNNNGIGRISIERRNWKRSVSVLSIHCPELYCIIISIALLFTLTTLERWSWSLLLSIRHRSETID